MRALLLLGEYGRGAPTARDSAPRGAAGAARPALGAPRWGVGGGRWAAPRPGAPRLLPGRALPAAGGTAARRVCAAPHGSARLCGRSSYSLSRRFWRGRKSRTGDVLLRGPPAPKGENLREEERPDEIRR